MKIAPFAIPVLVLLAACTASPDPVSTPPEPAGTRTTESQVAEEKTTEETSAAAEEPTDDPSPVVSTPPTDERGDIIKAVGELGGMTDANDEWTFDFTATSISLGTCSSSFAEPALNGHYLVLAFDVNTHPALDTTYGGFSLNPYDFVVFDSNNMRVNDPVGNAYSCLDSTETLPQEMGPSESASGKIAFDVPTETGTIAYRPADVDNGWTWSY